MFGRPIRRAGTVDLEVPLDRNGTHEPQILRKGQRRLDGIDKIVMGLCARGMTVRDIRPIWSRSMTSRSSRT